VTNITSITSRFPAETITCKRPPLICDIFKTITSESSLCRDLDWIDARRTKSDMTLGGILSESRKGNLSIVNITSIRTLARVKHTSQSKTMPGTSASDRTLETVPEPGSANTANPMMSPMYLSSPLDTILESMRDPNLRYVSLHDLIEAYSVFSSRIRAQLRVIIQANHPLPALAPLKEHSSVLARALTRDIRHVLIDPSNGLRRTPPSGESMFTHISMTDHEIQYARDLTILCHHALRFLSDVFVFKPLYSLFAGMCGNDLHSLFALTCSSRTRCSRSLQRPSENCSGDQFTYSAR
jgi:hypothetical protein